MRLFTYKMTHDTGFAPNPFWGFLTLTTCAEDTRVQTTGGLDCRVHVQDAMW